MCNQHIEDIFGGIQRPRFTSMTYRKMTRSFLLWMRTQAETQLKALASTAPEKQMPFK